MGYGHQVLTRLATSPKEGRLRDTGPVETALAVLATSLVHPVDDSGSVATPAFLPGSRCRAVSVKNTRNGAIEDYEMNNHVRGLLHGNGSARLYASWRRAGAGPASTGWRRLFRQPDPTGRAGARIALVTTASASRAGGPLG